ncbi:MAG: hypothetical protein AAGH64_01030 [Planctomycetota bacterium]
MLIAAPPGAPVDYGPYDSAGDACASDVNGDRRLDTPDLELFVVRLESN